MTAVVIVGDPEKLRNQMLVRSLESQFPRLQFSPPVYVEDDFYSAHLRGNRILIWALLGRNITKGELGASIAHLAARQLALSTGEKWCLILEDDASVNMEKLSTVLRWCEPRRDQAAAAILTNVSTKLSENAGCPVILDTMPSGAVGTLISRSALRFLVDDPLCLLVTADWPLSQSKIKFFGGVDVVSEVGAPSLVRHDRIARINIAFHYLVKIVFGVAAVVSKRVSLGEWWAFAIQRPIQRDLRIRIRRKRR